MAATELDAIERFCRAHRGHFALGLVRSNSPAETRRSLEELQQRGTRVAVLDFAGGEGRRLLDALRTVTTGCEAIAVVDADKLFLRDDGWVRQLNVEREAIRAATPAPLMIWAGDAAMDRLFADAPDFADWHSVVFRVDRLGGSGLETMAELASERGPLFGETLDRRIAALREIKQKIDSAPSAEPARKAAVAFELGSLLGRRGFFSDWDEEMALTKEAVAAFRGLAVARPEAYLGSLAGALHNWGIRLSALGQAEEALAAAREAVEIYRKLAVTQPDTLGDLAMSLNNCGAMLSAQNRAEEALEAVRESVEINRKLAEARPDDYLGNLALSLDNFGNRLSEVGRAEEALEAAHEAVEIYRKLATARPDAQLDHLATSLNNLGIRLSDVGRMEESLEAAREALEIYRKLATARPAAYLGDLAMALNNWGESLSAMGRAEEALEATREAVEIRRKLAAARPEAYLGDLASTLHNWGLRLNDVGLAGEALAAAREAVEISRRLAAARPDAYGPDLARSLVGEAWCLRQLQRHSEAVAAASESVATLRPYFLRNPGGFDEMMKGATWLYLTACDDAGTEPDTSLLDGLDDVLSEEL